MPNTSLQDIEKETIEALKAKWLENSCRKTFRSPDGAAYLKGVEDAVKMYSEKLKSH